MSGRDGKSPAYAEIMAEFFSGLSFDDIPERARAVAVRDLIDATGLCVSCRDQPYVQRLLAGWDSEGACTAIGHARALDSAGAALINGTGIHGEDFDDTLEGAPIRVGAMVIPAVLAAAERHGRSGRDALLGIIAGMEAVCRINHVVPGAIHKAGFHPVCAIGTLGASVGAGVALGHDKEQLTMSLGMAGSFASGILEYLTEGAWTKRMHPGWAAQSGLRAALFGGQRYFAPRTLFEGPNSFFRAFGPSGTPDYSHLHEGLGTNWYMENVAFKPYAAGTMIHPYIDCARRLAKEDRVDPERIVSIVCETGEGLVPRLWEPLAAKHAPPSGYAAKFSMPFCMAVGFFEDDAGLDQFTDEKAKDERILKLARKISYVIDPDNEFPRNYTGHMKVTLDDGTVIEKRQPHMRGGKREPLTDQEIIDKFTGNIAYGKWPEAKGAELLEFCRNLADHKDLGGLKAFRV